MKVTVLLSTYNGEKYLEEQLHSLIGQKGVETDILVRDDGSTDSTRNILDKWQKQGLLEWYSGENMGYALSFMDLVKRAPRSDYYAFCDQDDIWLEDKLQNAVESLEKVENGVKLYCSNVFYYKSGETKGGIHSAPPYYDRYTAMVRNIAPGCSMVFSERLKDILSLNPPKRLIAHDFWIFQAAMLLGEVVYDFTPSMLYRQHENNQIGQKSGRMEIWRRRIKQLSNPARRNERQEQAEEILRCFGSIMDEESCKIVGTVAGYRYSMAKKMRLLFEKKYTMGSLPGDIYLRLRIIFNRF